VADVKLYQFRDEIFAASHEEDTPPQQAPGELTEPKWLHSRSNKFPTSARSREAGKRSMRHEPTNEIQANSLADQPSERLTAELNELQARLHRLERQILERSAEISSEAVRSLIKAREVRTQLFADGLFADPAWDILLHLYAQELEHQRIAVSQLCSAAAVPQATASRHIKLLEDQGLVSRSDDELDGRRVWVKLSPTGSAAMRRYFQWLEAREMTKSQLHEVESPVKTPCEKEPKKAWVRPELRRMHPGSANGR
jgi:DNA-binding MarR family transcriptional regulator